MSPVFLTSPEEQDHLFLIPLLYKYSNKLSENATVLLCNSPNILASHIPICHQLILISCALHRRKGEKKHCVSKRHDFRRRKFKPPHEHPSLHV